MSTISARHHMLLRDQDTRNLNFADCFPTIILKQQHKDTQRAVYTAFCLDKDENLKEADIKFACAIRHENVFRYHISPFAFFLYSLLQARVR